MENYCKLISIISLSLSPLAVGADLDQCLKISNDRDRLKCYDKLHGFDQSSEANIGRLENRTLERPSPVKLGSSKQKVTRTQTAQQSVPLKKHMTLSLRILKL